MGNLNSLLGKKAEQYACEFLQKQGLRLIEKNYLCSQGEIDLVMRAGDELVFVEVRLRKNEDYADAIESIDEYKQRKILKTAEVYLIHRNLMDKVDCRFDVVGISYINSKATVEWIPDAFTADIF